MQRTLCRGLDDCPFIPNELIQSVKDAIKEFKETRRKESFKEVVKKLKLILNIGIISLDWQK